MKLKRVEFDNDENVSHVTVLIENDEELVFGWDSTGPEGLVFPVSISLDAEGTSNLFHRAGKVPGTDVYHEVATNVYCTLLPIVDRLIEYDC